MSNKENKIIKKFSFEELENLYYKAQAFQEQEESFGMSYCDQEDIEIKIYKNGNIEISGNFKYHWSEIIE